MKLVVHELGADGLSQVLSAPRRVNVIAVRPHLYRHNFAAGSLKMQIYQGVDLVAESAALDIGDIGSEDFFHGYVRFYVNALLNKDIEYTFKLVGDGYTFDESAYVGWCNGFDLGHYAATYEVDSKLHSPLDLEIWVRSDK